MRTASSIFVMVVLAIGLGACGESAADKAQATVCDARSDMSKQVAQLKSLTPATVTKDAVTQPLKAIKSDLKDVSGAQADLSEDRRSQVEAANKAFATSVKGISSELLKSVSAADAKAGLVTALQQLEASYRQTFAPIDCS